MSVSILCSFESFFPSENLGQVWLVSSDMYYKFLQLLLGASSLPLRQRICLTWRDSFEPWVSDAFYGNSCRWLYTLLHDYSHFWGSIKSIFLVTYTRVFLLSEGLSKCRCFYWTHTGGWLHEAVTEIGDSTLRPSTWTLVRTGAPQVFDLLQLLC